MPAGSSGAQLWEVIVKVAQHPGANISATIMLLAAVAVVVLIVVVLATLSIGAVSGSRKRKDPRELEELQELQSLLAVLESEDSRAAQISSVSVQAEDVRGYRLIAFAIMAVVVVVIALAIGSTTGTPDVCAACHLTNPHATAVRAGASDPHANVNCVECHESSGPVGSLTIEVPARISHFIQGGRENLSGKSSGYGLVVSSPCLRCHSGISDRTTYDAERGVKMAHKQPLEAGADCRDCHSASSGVVSSLTVGMAPCLRCHNGKEESTDCSLCHTKDIGAATRPHLGVTQMRGRKLVETPDCGLCHNERKSCDPCHGGQRMPHTDLFKWWGHARQGAKDIWFNNRAACTRCHYSERRPCTKCHAFFPGHPNPPFAKTHGAGGTGAGACNTCHGNKAYMAGREFCGLCHSKPYVTR